MIIRQYRIYDKSISDFKCFRYFNEFHNLKDNDTYYHKHSFKEKVYSISRCKIKNTFAIFEGILITKIYNQ